MITVSEIVRPEQLAEYRVLWRQMLGRTRGGSFFQTRECLEHALCRSETEPQLKTLVVCVAGHPVGIVPLVIRPLPTRMGPMRVLTYPAIHGAAHAGPIGPNPTATMLGALRHLASTPRDWDLLDLRGVDEAGLDRGRTANAFRLAQFPVHRRDWETSVVFDPHERSVVETYRFRQRLQAIERAFWSQGPWEHLQTTPRGDLAAETLAATWKVLQPLLKSRPVIEQHRLFELALIAARLNDLNVQILRRDSLPRGFLLTVRGNDRVEVLDAHAPDSRVAEVLVGKLLSGDFVGGETRVVFGPPWIDLARGWHAEIVTGQRYTHFSALQPRAQILRLAQWLKPKDGHRTVFDWTPTVSNRPTIALAKCS